MTEDINNKNKHEYPFGKELFKTRQIKLDVSLLENE